MDIKIIDGTNYFDLRVAAIVVNNGKVLTQKREEGNYYYLPGGKVQMGEKFKTALKREFIEETGLDDLVIGELKGIVENFYTNYEIKSHSVNIYFMCELENDSKLLTVDEMKGIEKGKKLIYKWIDLDSETLKELRPVSAQDIAKDNTEFCHLVNDLDKLSV